MSTVNIVAGNTYTFENLETGKFLNLYAGNTTNGTNVCQYDEDGSDEQKWTFRSDDKLYTNTSTTKCLDKYTVSGDAKNRNADLWTNDDDANQEVEFITTNADYVRIHLLGTSYYLAASAGSSNGANTAARKEPGAAGNVFWATYALADGEIESLDQFKWIARLDGEDTDSGEEVTGDYIINNKAIPKVGCEAGKYWTDDGTPSGDSLVHNNSYECAGFARYIYNYLWGSDTYGTAVTYRNLSGSSSDFSGISVGARINCDREDGSGNHSMVVVDKTSTGVTVYHANWALAENYCKIKFTTWTFAEFAEIFSNIKATSYTP